MRADVDHNLIAGKHARAAFIQCDLDRFRADETAAAHDEFGTRLPVKTEVKLDLAIDHVLLTASHPRHISSDPIDDRAEAGRIPNEMSHPRAPQFVLGGQTCHGGAGAADPLALHDGNLFAGPPQMPGKLLAALAAPEDDDVESFRLRHGCFLRCRWFKLKVNTSSRNNAGSTRHQPIRRDLSHWSSGPQPCSKPPVSAPC